MANGFLIAEGVKGLKTSLRMYTHEFVHTKTFNEDDQFRGCFPCKSHEMCFMFIHVRVC